jgi:hypothetical protein
MTSGNLGSGVTRASAAAVDNLTKGIINHPDLAAPPGLAKTLTRFFCSYDWHVMRTRISSNHLFV